MALVDADAGLLFTAAPGTGSTALREALLSRRDVTAVHELRDPTSWVHATPGALDGVVDALTLDFDAWLTRAIGEPQPRRVNAGHVEEAEVVLRMEHLGADLRDLTGLDIDVHRTNVTDRERAWWRSYSVDSRRLVEQTHAEDLARFGYAF